MHKAAGKFYDSLRLRNAHSSGNHPIEIQPDAAHICHWRTYWFEEELMQAQVGDRYQCSACGCEVQVMNAGSMEQEDVMGDSSEMGSEDESVGGSATGETGAGTLRKAETSGISTPGDFGSQGASGEGIFGTSGGGQRSTMSGRLGSSTASLRSSATGSSASSGSSQSGSGRYDDIGGTSTESEQESFSCCCGEPMTKSSGGSRGLSRSAQA
jgi:hypothetical protein